MFSEFLPDEHLKAIGRVTVEWSSLENALDLVLWQVAEIDFTCGQAITAHSSMNLKVDMLKTLLNERHRDSAAESEIQPLLRRIDQLRLERNKIVHSNWNTIFGWGWQHKSEQNRSARAS